MRFIDLSTFQPANYWITLSNLHTNEVLGMNPIDRSNYINENANKCWNESTFLNALKELGNRKCWYSEARSEVQLFVDHFRPKLMVTRIRNSYNYAEAGTRPLNTGYYWLSFDYNNYRISNNFTNKRKGGYFPLSSVSVSVETYPPGDITPEVHMLLDPCIQTDINLILYNIIKPKPVYTSVQNAHNYHRAEISIMAYSLDDSLLQTLRRRTLKMCNHLFIEAEKAFYANDWNSLSLNCSKLVDMLSPEAEFTMMIKHRLISLNKEWIDAYVLDEARELNFI
jgi:hypothetical protein